MAEPTSNRQASLDEVRAISFDLDDTLWHCAPAIAHANEVLFQWLQSHAPRIVESHTQDSLQQYQSGIRQKYPELRRCVSTIRRTGLKTLLVEHGYPESMAEQAFQAFYLARSEVQLYNGALDMLERLGTRYRLAAITNGNADLELIGIRCYFDAIHAADMQSAPKPEPDMFNECLKILELPAQALLHVGDNPMTDIVGGHNAGIQTLWFNQYNESWPEHLPRPHYQAGTLSEVVNLLLG